LDGFEDKLVLAPKVRVVAATGMASWLPAFQITDDDGSLRYLEFNGMYMGSNGYHIGPVANMGANDALMSGPLFDDKWVIVLSIVSKMGKRPRTPQFITGIGDANVNVNPADTHNNAWVPNDDIFLLGAAPTPPAATPPPTRKTIKITAMDKQVGHRLVNCF
jgi:hypothetical protein